MTECYICGSKDAQLPVESSLKKSFTDHQYARVPASEKICETCVYYLNLRCWYYNSAKEKWSKLFARNWSWLETTDYKLPKFGEEREEKGKSMPVVSELPTRRQILDLLLNPPEPPFLVAIAVSGQKHIRPFAIESLSREFIPVTFEKDLLYLQREDFVELEKVFARLRELGFSKRGIVSGNYNSKKLLENYTLPEYHQLEEKIASYRGSPQLELMGYLH